MLLYHHMLQYHQMSFKHHIIIFHHVDIATYDAPKVTVEFDVPPYAKQDFQKSQFYAKFCMDTM